MFRQPVAAGITRDSPQRSEPRSFDAVADWTAAVVRGVRGSLQFVLKIASEKKLLSEKTVGVDSTALEADAAMTSIVRMLKPEESGSSG